MSGAVSETMTVNHALKVLPGAQQVFHAFHIDEDAEGLHCLDELYWRRGVDVERLLKALEREARRCPSTN